MSIQLAFTSRTQPTGLWAAARAKLGELRREWQQAAARRQEIARITHELSVCTDRQLADLGLSRGDIPDVARGSFKRA